MFVRSHVSKTSCPNFTKFSVRRVRPICGCGSVLCQQCTTLCRPTTYGFVGDVIFAHNLRGKCDANRAYTKSDSPEGNTDSMLPLVGLRHKLKLTYYGPAPEAKSWFPTVLFLLFRLLWPPYEIGGPLYFCPVVTIFMVALCNRADHNIFIL